MELFSVKSSRLYTISGILEGASGEAVTSIQFQTTPLMKQNAFGALSLNFIGDCIPRRRPKLCVRKRKKRESSTHRPAGRRRHSQTPGPPGSARRGVLRSGDARATAGRVSDRRRRGGCVSCVTVTVYAYAPSSSASSRRYTKESPPAPGRANVPRITQPNLSDSLNITWPQSPSRPGSGLSNPSRFDS